MNRRPSGRARPLSLVFTCVVAALPGCGSAAHEPVRDPRPEVLDVATRPSMAPVDGPASPLVIDWKVEDRADLEEAMHDGIAIVAWDQRGPRLLKRCRLNGDYGYLPIQLKEYVIRLDSSDEVRSNLPRGGVDIAAKLGKDLDHGSTVDIAMAMIGKRRTTWSKVSSADLNGDCTDATHYVRATDVGAFAMRTGAKAHAPVASEIFGMGGSGAPASDRSFHTVDGKLDACEKATGDESKPVGQCAAILRIELEPIPKAMAIAAVKGGEEKPETMEACPAGLVFAAGKCTLPRAEVAHTCKTDDVADCEEQCAKGNGESCYRAGLLINNGKKGNPPDRVTAYADYQKACALGSGTGCAAAGFSQIYGGGTAKDPKAGAAMVEKGCRMGSAKGCTGLGIVFEQGKGVQKNPASALKYYAKGCDGGEYAACNFESAMYAGAEGVTRDDTAALALARRACFGGDGYACESVGEYLELGLGMPKDTASALTMYERGCALEKKACFGLAAQLFVGDGVKKDTERSKSSLDTACKAESAIACQASMQLHGGAARKAGPQELTTTLEDAKPRCDRKMPRACTTLGLAQWAVGKVPEARISLKAGCDLKDPIACELAKRAR